MSKRFFLASIVGAALAASPANAALIAGWDFGQYISDGFLSTDGATFTSQLSANYSELDPSGSGIESAAFGTLYYDGTRGSTAVNAASDLLPVAGSLLSNVNNAPPSGFDIDTTFEGGQTFFNYMRLTAATPLSIVFEADLTSAGGSATDWTLSFGGQTFEGSSTVGIFFSTNGTDYTSAGQVSLNTNDLPYNVALTAAGSSKLFVKLDFSGFQGVTGQPTIDNLGIYGTVIPEPGTVVLLLSGLAGLAAVGRRRA